MCCAEKRFLLGKDGVELVRTALRAGCIAQWSAAAKRRYHEIDSTRWREGPRATGLPHLPLPQGQKFIATASSLSLEAACGAEQPKVLCDVMAAAPWRRLIENALGGPVLCDLDQAWVRRQYAPANYPPLHAPHGWHQDGALGFDFLAHSDGSFPPDALLRMVTCWIPLSSCGVDAPGLEFVMRRHDRLLPVTSLTDTHVRARFAPAEFHVPTMQPGDVLLFCGDILHRTYVTPAMRNDRTSIELRFFAADRIPPRLARDRFVPLG